MTKSLDGYGRAKMFAFMLSLLSITVPAFGAGWDPPGWRKQTAPPAEPPTNPAVLPFVWAVRAYQTTASRVDGDKCPSYPTCSAYAVQALRKHGPILGTLLTAGRLLSDADQAAFSPRIFIGGQWKVYAPLEDDLAFLRGRLPP